MEAKVSVILPTYNERDNVGQVIDEITKKVSFLGEVIVVDDDSPDRTWVVVEEIAKANSQVRLIKKVNERGLTSAIWTGIENAKSEYVVWLDCDMGMPPEFIPQLIKELDNYDIAIGSRYVTGGKDLRAPLRRTVSYFLNLFAGFILGVNIRDLTTGFVASRREVFDKIRLKGDYGEYCIRFLYEAQRMGYRIREIPYIFKERIKGKSKSESNFIKFGIGYIYTIFKLRRLSL